jgi:choice-of-anchor C domain-containing protein
MHATRLAATLALAVSTATVASAAGGNLIQDGGFEVAGPVTSWISLSAGSATVPGWRVSSGSGALVGRFFRAYEGTNSLEVGSPGAGTIEQTIPTVAGRRYRLAFALAGNPEGPPRVKQLYVTAGAMTRTFSFDVAGHSRTAMGWVRETLDFTATGATTAIRFARMDGGRTGWWGPVIDDVSVIDAAGVAPATAEPNPPGPRATIAPMPQATAAPVMRATPAPAAALPQTFKPSGNDPYSGLWAAAYPGGSLRVFLERHGNNVAAHAIDGHAAIPAGHIAWQGSVSGSPAVVLATCTDADAKGWHGAVIEWSGQDAFHLRIANCHAGDVLYTRTR